MSALHITKRVVEVIVNVVFSPFGVLLCSIRISAPHIADSSISQPWIPCHTPAVHPDVVRLPRQKMLVLLRTIHHRRSSVLRIYLHLPPIHFGKGLKPKHDLRISDFQCRRFWD